MKRKPNAPHRTPAILSDPENGYTLLCLCCGTETGEKMNVRSSLADPVEMFGPDKANWKMRKGLCPRCESEVRAGASIFYTDTRGIIVDIKPRKDGAIVIKNAKGDLVILEGDIIGKASRVTDEQMEAIAGPVVGAGAEKKNGNGVDNPSAS